MNKYIVEYSTGDGCTYRYDVVKPLISPESADQTRDTILLKIHKVIDCLSRTDALNFFLYPSLDNYRNLKKAHLNKIIQVELLDEWFNRHN